MKDVLPYVVKRFVLLAIIFFAALKSHATHIFGVDLYYTHVSGNTYTVHLVVYGDCSGAAFGSLPTSVPEVDVYNGNTYISTLNLALQAPTTGVEVTPVCPADAGLTTCTNTSYTIPGVKKFVYTANTTLSGTSAVWRFLFQGNMGGGGSAGRSSSITNITTPGSTVIQLVDTLNNIPATAHSNATFTAIPTPFFCDNVPANYNPGAVPTAGDSLAIFLVPGIDATSGTSVNYIAPYTATAPLATSPGTFSMNNATGELSFTPNILQRSLVVYNVEEYNGGMLRGTCQREMTILVLTCSSAPPTGGISGATAGTMVSPTTFDICDNVGAYSFHINPTSPGGYNITMTASGLPAGATFTIVGNGTLAPTSTFSWTTTGVAPGAYIFYVTFQDNGCPISGIQTIAYTINVLPVPTESFALVSPATCVRKAVFDVTPGGSASPWTVKIIQSGITIQTLTGVTGMVTDSLVPGTYTIRMTNPSGCYVDTIVTLVAPTLPIPGVTTTAPLCPGGATGTATITATGGLAPYLFAIGTGAYGSSGTFTGLTPGSYTLHIKDANGCIKDTTVTVPNATPILMNIAIRKPLCDTFTNGVVIISAYNSVGPYTYALGTGTFSADDTFTNLGAGTYTFHIKNANGCVVDTTFDLVDSVAMHGTLSISPVLCNGGSATVTITATGGSALPYTYANGTGPFGLSDMFTIPAGAYTFHVHDANACHWDTSITLTQPAPITITAATTNILCNGASTGIIVIAATGGTPAYNYDIDGGTYGSSNIFTGLTAGRHIIDVKDADGCVYADTVTLTQPSAIAIDSVVMVKPLCNGASNGSVTVYATGGITPYNYAVGTGTYGSSRTFTGLAAGAYTLHVKDANGCIKDTAVTLSQPAAITPIATVTPSLCQTLANGKVVVSATGGTPAYTYAIGTGSFGTSGTFTPLAAGTYTFHIKDANGCTKDTTLTVTDSMHITGMFTITPALCYNQASGVINVTGTGGTSPYVYGIASGSYGAGHVFSSLLAGSYMIHIKDANGCKDDTLVTVTQPAAITPGVTITEPSCNGYTNGSVTVTATGGTPAYTYSWNNSSFTGTTTYTGLAAGVDSIIIKDANGCLHDTVFTIRQPSKIAFTSIVLTNISCYNGANGSITINGSGATPPYVYAVDSAAWQAANSFTGLTAGMAFVKIKDNNGCELDTNIVLTQPTQLIITSADTVDPTCVGYTDGAVTIHVAGGTPSYGYSDDGITYNASDVFNKLGAGTYTFIIKDANGCNVDTTITLTGLPPIIVDSVNITQPLCYGENNGSFTIVAGGGVPPFTYQFDGGNTHYSIGLYKDIYAGAHQVVITDAMTCIKDTTVVVPQPDSISITSNVVLNPCLGEENKGSIAVNVTGGTAVYAYLWSTNPPQATAGISGLANGTYVVWVKDANGCTDSLKTEITYDDCCTPYIPNAFTPNGDGKNDYFKLLVKGDIYIITFSVYNRFGQRVYNISNTNNPDPGWDGKFDGIDADMGTYYYYAKIICGNKGDHKVELKGDVTLIR